MKSTNKYIQLIVLWAIALTGLTGCDTELDVNEKIAGFTKLNSKVIYPEGSFDDYRVEFNGQNVKDGFFTREETEGELKVYYPKDATKAEVTIPYNIDEQGTNIELIRLPGKKFELYKAENFTTFQSNIIYQGTADDYAATFNGQQLVQGLNYYNKTKGLTGKLQIAEKSAKEPLFSQEITIDEAGKTKLDIMQLSEELFLSIPEDTEPDPESDRFTKVRFFYTANDFPGVNKLKVTAMDWMSLTEVGTVEIAPGELSPYITVDWNKVSELSPGNFNGLTQVVSDAETGEVFVDGGTNFNASIDINPYTTGGVGPYKKATCQVTKGDVINPFASLSFKWNP